MGQRIYFNFVNVRKYLRVNKETGERQVVPVTNRNALSVERHIIFLRSRVTMESDAEKAGNAGCVGFHFDYNNYRPFWLNML